MAIIAKLYDNETEIGKMTAFLIDPVENLDPDTICQYAWILEQDGQPVIKSEPHQLVEHQDGDGAWTLVGEILTQASHAAT